MSTSTSCLPVSLHRDNNQQLLSLVATHVSARWWIAQARDGFAIGQLDDGRVIVAGGTHYPFGVVESGLRTAEMWLPTTNAWQKMPSMNDGHGRPKCQMSKCLPTDDCEPTLTRAVLVSACSACTCGLGRAAGYCAGFCAGCRMVRSRFHDPALKPFDCWVCALACAVMFRTLVVLPCLRTGR